MLRHAALVALRSPAARRVAPTARLRSAQQHRATGACTAHTLARGKSSTSSSSSSSSTTPLPPRHSHTLLRTEEGRSAPAQPVARGAAGKATARAAAAAPATAPSSSEPVTAPHGREEEAAPVAHTTTTASTTAEPQQQRPVTTRSVPDDADLPTLAAALRALGPLQPRVTFLLGGPGAGKGTLSERITSREGHVHVSVGALLRAASASGTAAGRRISATMSRGGMVGSTDTTSLLLRHLLEDALHGRVVFVDGYPRTFANAVMFDSLGLRPARVIAMEVAERVMWERLSGRGRRDDVPDIVRNRLVQFRAEWESIKEFYRRRELLVELDADGHAEDVWKRYVELPAPNANA